MFRFMFSRDTGDSHAQLSCRLCPAAAFWLVSRPRPGASQPTQVFKCTVFPQLLTKFHDTDATVARGYPIHSAFTDNGIFNDTC